MSFGISHSHSALREQLRDDGSGLLDLVALLLERALHGSHSVSQLGRLQRIEILDALGDVLKIIRAFVMLVAAVLELLFQFLGVEFALQHALHPSLRDVLCLGGFGCVLGSVLHSGNDWVGAFTGIFVS